MSNLFSNAEVPAVPAPAPRKRVGPKAVKATSAKPVSASAALEPSVVLPPRTGPRSRDVIDGKSDYKLVLINDLHDDPENPRKTFRNIAELAASITAEGLLQPIVARIDSDGKLIIMWGHRRKRACQLLKMERVPVIIRYGVKDGSILAKQLIENSHRDDLDPIEEARGIRHFMHEKRIATYADAAKVLGHSLSWVANRVALLDLDQDEQEAVSEGTMKVTEAATIARKKVGNTRVSRIQREGPPPQHLGDTHPLAGRAKSRCNAGRMRGDDHKPILSGTACGACWEVVIRLDAIREYEEGKKRKANASLLDSMA